MLKVSCALVLTYAVGVITCEHEDVFMMVPRRSAGLLGATSSIINVPGGARTLDNRIKGPVLYRLSYEHLDLMRFWTYLSAKRSSACERSLLYFCILLIISLE